jgi:ribonuclease-3
LQNVDAGANLRDPKTRLQEYLQASKNSLPSYQVEQITGKSHDQVFTVKCQLTDLDMQSSGKGSSRKKAEQQAAQKILNMLGL